MSCEAVHLPLAFRANELPRFRRGFFLHLETPAGSAGAASAALCRSRTLPRLSGMPWIESAPLPQQKVFQDVFLFAASEWSAANAASYFVIDGLRPRLGFDHLVDCPAA